MNFIERDRLNDIKMTVQRRMEEAEKVQKIPIPIPIAKKLYKQYFPKIELLETKVADLWDEPNKRMTVQKQLDDIQFFVNQLKTLIDGV